MTERHKCLFFPALEKPSTIALLLRLQTAVTVQHLICSLSFSTFKGPLFLLILWDEYKVGVSRPFSDDSSSSEFSSVKDACLTSLFQFSWKLLLFRQLQSKEQIFVRFIKPFQFFVILRDLWFAEFQDCSLPQENHELALDLRSGHGSFWAILYSAQISCLIVCPPWQSYKSNINLCKFALKARLSCRVMPWLPAPQDCNKIEHRTWKNDAGTTWTLLLHNLLILDDSVILTDKQDVRKSSKGVKFASFAQIYGFPWLVTLTLILGCVLVLLTKPLWLRTILDEMCFPTSFYILCTDSLESTDVGVSIASSSHANVLSGSFHHTRLTSTHNSYFPLKADLSLQYITCVPWASMRCPFFVP